MDGWIKLHRRITEWEWYKEPNVAFLFIHILLNANYETKDWRGVTINPGQLITGRKALAFKTGLSEQSVRTALNRLKSTSDLTIKSTSKYSIITVVKWELYQSTNQQPNQQVNQQTHQRLTTTKEEKNLRTKETKNKKVSKTTGTRFAVADLPEDWKDFAFEKRPDLDSQELFDEFKDYWIGVPGQRGRKIDWFATWRNRVRDKKRANTYNNPKSKTDLALEEYERRYVTSN